MPDHSTLNLEELLKHPQVEKATGDINAELLERRNYAPPRCSVFSHPYTVLQETDRYRFELDREAERQLPDIISNKVQLIRGEDSLRFETEGIALGISVIGRFQARVRREWRSSSPPV